MGWAVSTQQYVLLIWGEGVWAYFAGLSVLIGLFYSVAATRKSGGRSAAREIAPEDAVQLLPTPLQTH